MSPQNKRSLAGHPLGTDILAIDTDLYAGNFERALAAYVAGIEHYLHDFNMFLLEDCQKALLKENLTENFKSLLGTRLYDPGDDGYLRAPVFIVPSPNGKYNSVGLVLNRLPSSQELDFIKRRAFEFEKVHVANDWEQRPKILGFRLLSERIVLSEQSI